MPVRRAADPISVQHVWDAVKYANESHLSCSLPVIVKYLQAVENCSTNRAELHVKQCLQDGLLKCLQKLGSKGSKVGTTLEIYRIPFDEFENLSGEEKDWYCIECHLAGDVIACKKCHRVFHSECVSVSKKKLYDFRNVSKTCNNYNIKATLENRLSSLNNSKSSILSSGSFNKSGDEIKDTSDTQNVEEKSKDSACSLVGIFESFDKIEEDNLESLEALVDSEIEGRKNKNETISNEKRESAVEKEDTEIKSNDEKGNANKDIIDAKNGYDECLCRICNLLDTDDESNLEKKELNYLLLFVFKRIRSWIPAYSTDKIMAPGETHKILSNDEVKWRTSRLFHQSLEMPDIEEKLVADKYDKLCEFLADVITVQHNVAIFHGIESQEYGAAELMYEDCNYDLSELRNCVDCYKHSNEKINSKWFSLPCRNPHKLVWAKQKGYPYWPAKVIKEANGKFDVRFFGGNHERSLLQKTFVKPISTPMNSLQVKKNAAFKRALEELELHQRLIDNPSEVQKLINEKSDKTERKSQEKKASHTNSRPTSRLSKKLENQTPSDDEPISFDDICDNFENSFSKKGLKRKHSLSPASGSSKSNEQPKKKTAAQGTAGNRNLQTNKRNSTDVINLTSDGDEDISLKDDDQFSTEYGEVSSSTEHIKVVEDGVKDGDGIMQQLDRQYSEAVERTKQKLEKCKDKKHLIKVALDSMQAEIDRINNAHDDYLKKIFEAHNQEISQTKKKQWCYNCEQDAIYHCCWNTAYCSPTCQQQHWQAEHKKVCRRKR